MPPISPPIKLSAAEERAIKHLVKANQLSCSDMQINIRTNAESNTYKRMKHAAKMCPLDLQLEQTHQLNDGHMRRVIHCTGMCKTCATPKRGTNRGFSVGINKWKWLRVEPGVNTALSWLLPRTHKHTTPSAQLPPRRCMYIKGFNSFTGMESCKAVTNELCLWNKCSAECK